jgi:hypothetical protein
MHTPVPVYQPTQGASGGGQVPFPWRVIASASCPASPAFGARLYTAPERAETCGFDGPKSGKT